MVYVSKWGSRTKFLDVNVFHFVRFSTGVSFDFLIGSILLYAEERQQYEQIKNKSDLRKDRGHSLVIEQYVLIIV